MHALFAKGVVGETTFVSLDPDNITVRTIDPEHSLFAARAAVTAAERLDFGDRDLKDIQAQLVEMSELVSAAILGSAEALRRGNEPLAEKVRRDGWDQWTSGV